MALLLACFELWIGFVDNVELTATTDELTIWVADFGTAQGSQNFHDETPIRKLV